MYPRDNHGVTYGSSRARSAALGATLAFNSLKLPTPGQRSRLWRHAWFSQERSDDRRYDGHPDHR